MKKLKLTHFMWVVLCALCFSTQVKAQTDACGAAPAVTDGATAFNITGFGGTDITTCTFNDFIDGWFVYTASCTGNATFDLCGSGYDTALSIFDGCGGAELGCNDDACGLQSEVAIGVTSGTQYWVRLSGWNGNSGSGTLNISCAVPPPPPGPQPCAFDAYGINNLAGNFVGVDPNDGSQTVIAPITDPVSPGAFLAGGEIIGGVYYTSGNGNVHAVDLASGAIVNLILGCLPNGLTGLDNDPTTGTFYGIGLASFCGGGSQLVEIDLGTGTCTNIGGVNGGLGCPIGLVIDEFGDAWVIDIIGDDITPISLADGTSTGPSLPLGFNLNFGQDYAFDDPSGGLIYGYMFDGGGFQQLYVTIDPLTGTVTVITNLGFDQTASFAFCNATPPGGGGTGCQIACAPDITVSTDPLSDCNAYVDIDPVEITGNCDLNTIVNDYNGTTNASDTYPLGDTEVCWTVVDQGTGNTIQCCMTVTVQDNTAPVFENCPGDMTINLDAGECEAAVSFDVTATEECGIMDININQNTGVADVCDNGTNDTGVVCFLFGQAESRHGRLFDLQAQGITADYTINEVELGYLYNFGPGFRLDLYAVAPGVTPPTVANLGAPVYTEQFVPPAASGNFQCGAFALSAPVTIPAGQSVFAAVSGSGDAFGGWWGVYDQTNGQDAPSYYMGCTGIFPDWIDIASLGGPFPGVRLNLQLNGEINVSEIEGTPDPGNQFASGDAFPIGENCLTYTAVDQSGNQSTCEFCITVNEFQGQTNSLTCNDHVNISLDEFCESLVGADDILEGGPYGCYDDYVVNLFYGPGLTNPVPTSPLLTAQEVGQTLYVQVVDPEHPQNNSCWGTIYVEDKIIPALECSDFALECNDSDLPGAAGVPFPLPAGFYIAPADIANGSPYTVSNYDPCGPVTLSYEDSSADGDCVNDDFIFRITRTWTAVDQSGNTTTCDDHIEISRSVVGDVIFPTDKDGLEDDYLVCNNVDDDQFIDDVDPLVLLDANGHPHPDVTGWPQVNGQNIQSGGVCEFAVEYEDQVFPICEGTYKIVRTWTVLAWCPTTTIENDIQVIKVVDDIPPVITCPATMTVSTGQNDCTASVILPVPTITDYCSSNPSYTISVSQGFLQGHTLFGLPLGVTSVTYTATDACGNESECTWQILVRDQINPIAICESFHVVGLTVDEPTLVPALVFDDGSYDNCELVHYQVRRMDNPNCPGNDATPFGDYVPFYCCDVGGPNVMVELRVGDGATPTNWNSCMIEVEVQDKLNPAILCPPPKLLTCYEDPYDLDLTGYATASDNCSVEITHVDQGGLDNCGEGTINRIWTATDPGGRTASCVQVITVINDDPFEICDTECWTTPLSISCPPTIFWTGHTLADDVEWPCDIELDQCGPGLSPDELELNSAVHPWNVRPRIIEDGCDLVAVTYEDLELPITAPGCIKILRNWIILDWCQYNPNTGFGRWEYQQIIKVLESAAPEILSDCEDIAFCSYDEDCLTGPAELILEADDDCTADEDLNYYYWVWPFGIQADAIHGFGNDASGDYPLGTHHIVWHVEDGCGNVSICEYDFIIDDCKKPTPYAYNGLAVEIMPVQEMVTLWAVDFDAGSFDNCGISEFRIATPSGGPGQTTPPPFPSAGVDFTCDDIGTQTVDLWVGDVNGNWDYVSTYVIVQDNQQVCNGPSGASISGTIDNEEGVYVQDVMVDIDGTAPGMPDPDVTGIGGGYGFPGLAANHNYVLTPEKDVDPLNGVTTYDLVLISKHILGIENLDSPYKMIAADINNSGSVSTIDMVELRKMILFIDTEFQNNTSWRFVDASFVFPDATNPFGSSFPEIFSVNGLNANEIADFVGVKTGDVNGSAIANFAAGGDDRNTVGDLVFNIDDVDMVAGEQYTVDFQAKDFANLLGYQFTLAFDKDAVEFVDVEAGKLTDLNANNFGMSLLEEGVITTSWNANQATSLENADVVFSVTFTAKSNTQLSEVLAVNSRYTVAEAYDNNADVLNIGISFNNGSVVAGDFDLYQNQPNPFKAETVIGFNLPEAGAATLTVYDVSGKVLKLVKGDYAQGYNEVTLNRAELSGAGVLYYQLDTDTDSATKKMIVID